MRKLISTLHSAAHVLMIVLKEIFDESAYARFLERSKRGASREAYSVFCRERDATRERRPRCC